MSVSSRIREYCESKNIRQTDLIKKKIAVKGTIDKIWHDKQEPNSKFLNRLLVLYKDIDARWLLTGNEYGVVEETRIQYGYCRECLKKEGVIEFLRKEISIKEKEVATKHKMLEECEERLKKYDFN